MSHLLPEIKKTILPEEERASVRELLRSVYGYEQFRELEVYADLFKGKETIRISQGQDRKSVV